MRRRRSFRNLLVLACLGFGVGPFAFISLNGGDDVDFKQPVYGGIMVEGNAVVTPISVIDTYTKVEVFDTDLTSEQFEVNSGNNTLDAPFAFDCQIIVTVRAQAGEAGLGTTYSFQIFSDAGVTEVEGLFGQIEVSAGMPSGAETITIQAIVSLEAGDQLGLFVKDETSTRDALIINCSITGNRVDR